VISLTKLLGGAAHFGDALRYHSASSEQKHGTSPGSGPVVVWNSTKRCNLECLHCYADAERRRFAGELTTEEAKAMIDDLVGFNIPALLISGGEPFVRPDILELAAYARERGLRITFSTNGTRIGTREAERLRELGVGYVGISIDGNEATHDLFRGQRGAYAGAIRGIRNCRAAGLRVGIRFTATRDNIDDLPSIFNLVEREGIGRLCIYHLVYSGRGSGISSSDLSVDEKRAMMDQLYRQVDRWSVTHPEIEVLTVDNHADGPYTYLWLLENDPSRADAALSLIERNGGNRSGIAIACIDSFGMVHPDQFSGAHTIGSIRDRPFSEIWKEPDHPLMEGLRNRKPLLQGRCADCRWLNVCNGNFRIRAEAATGDYWQSDPGCYLTSAEIAR
jgi:Fe-coproporphyrin III synthase